MRWPQIAMIMILGASVGLALAKDGEQKTEKYSFVVTLMSAVIEAIILGAGGFWK